jgi:hypothetical protein
VLARRQRPQPLHANTTASAQPPARPPGQLQRAAQPHGAENGSQRDRGLQQALLGLACVDVRQESQNVFDSGESDLCKVAVRGRGVLNQTGVGYPFGKNSRVSRRDQHILQSYLDQGWLPDFSQPVQRIVGVEDRLHLQLDSV